MTTSGGPPSPGVSRRRWLLLLTAALTAAIVAEIAIRFAPRPAAPPTPPSVPQDNSEPQVTSFVERSRERVLQNPRKGSAWGELGQAFLANDMDSESQVCFAEAERLERDNPRWPYFQAVVLVNHGEREAALPLFQRSVELCEVAEPDNVVPQLVLAETLLALGRTEEAEGNIRQVLSRRTDDARAHYDLALAASARQDWETSRTHLLRCTGNPFAQQKASVQLAAVCQRLGDTAEAEKFRQQANRVPLDQEWVDPFVTEYLAWAVKKRNRYRRAESLEAVGRLKESAAVLLPMLEEYPDDYLPRVSLGKILGRLGDHRGAEQVLREALRLAPDKVQVHYYLSLVLFAEAEEAAGNDDRGRTEKLYREAVQRAREALAIKSDYGYAHMALGRSLKGLGKRAEALTAIQQAVRCNPEHAELHFHLGDMLAEDGRKSEAREQLEQAVQMGPPEATWRATALARLAALRSGNAAPDKPQR